MDGHDHTAVGTDVLRLTGLDSPLYTHVCPQVKPSSSTAPSSQLSSFLSLGPGPPTLPYPMEYTWPLSITRRVYTHPSYAQEVPILGQGGMWPSQGLGWLGLGALCSERVTSFPFSIPENFESKLSV